jgi:hypothetical protein
LLSVAARGGGRNLFERLAGEARRSRDREEQAKLYWGLGNFSDPALASEALALLLDEDLDLRESVAVLWGLVTRSETQGAAWAFVREHFDRLSARSRSDEAGWLIGGTVSRFCTEERRRGAAAFFEPRVARIDGAGLALANALETVDACIAEDKRNAAAVAEFLGRY